MMRRKSRVSHSREAFYIGCILLVVLIGLYSFFGSNGYREMRQSQTDLEMRHKQTEAIEKDIEKRSENVKGLRDDPAVIEAYARKNRYARKGEVIQEVPDTGESSNPPPEGPAAKTPDPKDKSTGSQAGK